MQLLDTHVSKSAKRHRDFSQGAARDAVADTDKDMITIISDG